MPHSMTPVRGFWLGLVLTVLGLAGGALFFNAVLAVGGQSLASSVVVRVVVTVAVSVMLPLGVTFVALSVVARALGRRSVVRAVDPVDPREDIPSMPPLVSSRTAVVTGLVLLVVGLVLQLFLAQWTQEIQGDETFLRDFVVYLGPPLDAFILPLGVLLIPCAWILRIIEEPRIPDL
ncbi:MAG: hypothetical protein H7311_14825 [Ramlibacter sp.]|nr:hypothetical protein [Cryobacterium sp.]